MAATHHLLLIHGLGATGRVWDGWQKLLDERWPERWLAPDLPGHGSAAPLDDYTFANMTDVLAKQLDKDTPYVVVGHSLGGVIGLELASGRYGVRIETVFGLGIKVKWTRDELAKAKELANRPVQWFEDRDEAATRYLRIAGLAGLVDPADESADAGLVHEDGRYKLALDNKAFGVGKPDMPKLLEDSQADVILARGEHDPMNTDRQLAALHPNVVTLPRLGHNAHVEDPAAVLRLVTAHTG